MMPERAQNVLNRLLVRTPLLTVRNSGLRTAHQDRSEAESSLRAYCFHVGSVRYRGIITGVPTREFRLGRTRPFLGLILLAAAGRLLESLVLNVSPYDPAGYLRAALVLLAAVSLSGLVPALQMARQNPRKSLGSL